MAAPSGKQLAMAWLHFQLNPAKITVDEDTFRDFYQPDLTEKRLKEAEEFLKEEIGKLQKRFTDYTEKYFSDALVAGTETHCD